MGRNGLKLGLTLLTLLGSAGLAHADDAAAQQPDRSGFTLFNPAPDSALRAFCTDRPTKSNAPCTVDAGRIQVEADIVNATFQRTGGVTTDTYIFANPTVKLGLTNTLDAEVNIAPLETIVTHDHGARSTFSGVGDLFARLKWNLIGDDGGDVSISLSPYVKAPTANHHVGNGAVEGGLLVPVQINLPAGWSFGFNGEIDALKNQNDDGRHANYVAIVSLNHALTKTVTGSVELWNDVNGDPSGVVRQYSFDLALAWIPEKAPNLQFDGGLNIGLNNVTPGAQVYVGVSRRF